MLTQDLPTTVAVVATSPVIRAGLAHVLSHLPGLTVGQVADNVGELSGERPGLIVADVHSLDARAAEELLESLPAGARVIALCSPASPPDLLTAIHAGVHALVAHDGGADELPLAVRTALHGGLHVSPDLFATMSARPVSAPPARYELARREVEVVRFLADGLTHRQIGRRLGLTEATVSTYVKRIRAKLHAGNKAELTRRAIELGYVTS